MAIHDQLQGLLAKLSRKLGVDGLPDYVILGQRESLRLWKDLASLCTYPATGGDITKDATVIHHAGKAIRVIGVPVTTFLELGWNDLAGKSLYAEMRRRAMSHVWGGRADG